MTKPSAGEKTPTPAILFDLDGTLMDSNYEHIAAWREAFRTKGLEIPSARIHRCVGMSGTADGPRALHRARSDDWSRED